MESLYSNRDNQLLLYWLLEPNNSDTYNLQVLSRDAECLLLEVEVEGRRCDTAIIFTLPIYCDPTKVNIDSGEYFLLFKINADIYARCHVKVL